MRCLGDPDPGEDSVPEFVDQLGALRSSVSAGVSNEANQDDGGFNSAESVLLFREGGITA